MSVTARVLILVPTHRCATKPSWPLILWAKMRRDFVSSKTPISSSMCCGINQLIWCWRSFPSNPRIEFAVRQIHSMSTQTRVAAVLRTEGFHESVNESSVLIDAMRSGVCDFLRRPLSTVDLERLLVAGVSAADERAQLAATSTRSRRLLRQQ